MGGGAVGSIRGRRRGGSFINLMPREVDGGDVCVIGGRRRGVRVPIAGGMGKGGGVDRSR